MMPIWDEEWGFAHFGVPCRTEQQYRTELHVGEGQHECIVWDDASADHEEAAENAARAKLAAAAPAMARLLLELEWAAGGSWGPSGDESTNTNFACALCEGTRGEWIARSGTKYPAGHAPDCRWLAVMRAAGVRE